MEEIKAKRNELLRRNKEREEERKIKTQMENYTISTIMNDVPLYKKKELDYRD